MWAVSPVPSLLCALRCVYRPAGETRRARLQRADQEFSIILAGIGIHFSYVNMTKPLLEVSKYTENPPYILSPNNYVY